MTTLPPNHQFGRPVVKQSLTNRTIRNFPGVRLPVALSIASAALIVGCVAKNTTPVETVFSEPVTVTLPTKELDDTIAAVQQADVASRETTNAINAMNAQNLSETQPEAARWSQKTSEAIQAALSHSAKAKSLNEIAADRIIEATNQTNDARDRLKASEAQREVERIEAQAKIDKAEKAAADARSWLPRIVGGFAGTIGVGLIVVGIYATWTAKTTLNGTAMIASGVVSMSIGWAAWMYGWIIGLVGVAFVIAIGKFQIINQIRKQREQAKQIIRGVESLKAAKLLPMTDEVKGVLNSSQTSSATRALVNTITSKTKPLTA